LETKILHGFKQISKYIYALHYLFIVPANRQSCAESPFAAIRWNQVGLVCRRVVSARRTGVFTHKFLSFLILMAPGDDTDSGLESLSASNKSLATSSRKDSKDMKSEVEDDIDDEVRTDYGIQYES
jgi:hypothetical protein